MFFFHCSDVYYPPRKLTASFPLKRGFLGLKRKPAPLPTIHFQGLLLALRFREGRNSGFVNSDSIWGFPEMVVPPNHPKMIIFSRKTDGCWGNPSFKETPICSRSDGRSALIFVQPQKNGWFHPPGGNFCACILKDSPGLVLLKLLDSTPGARVQDGSSYKWATPYGYNHRKTPFHFSAIYIQYITPLFSTGLWGPTLWRFMGSSFRASFFYHWSASVVHTCWVSWVLAIMHIISSYYVAMSACPYIYIFVSIYLSNYSFIYSYNQIMIYMCKHIYIYVLHILF